MSRTPLIRLVAAVLAVGAVVAIVGLPGGDSASERTMTVTFARTTGLHEGAKVKVLGVQVGRVTRVEPKGAAVEVDIAYSEVKLPASVVAAIVPPSIVGDRFVQLAPVYDGGPVLADRARLGLDRSRVPVELDETFAALNTLAEGLGPDGANKDGALSRLVTTSADALRGRGTEVNRTLGDLATALQALDAAGGDVSATVRNLGTLSDTFAGDDDIVRSLVTRLASVSTTLSAQRGEVSAAVTELTTALGDLDRFVETNRAGIASNISAAASVTDGLNKRIKEISRLLDLAPAGIANLGQDYVPNNWDPNRPGASLPVGRTGSLLLRAALPQDLDTQLGFTLNGLCAQLPVAQQQGIASLCGALRTTGGSIGGLLSGLVENNAGSPLNGSSGLAGLLGGAR